jgi:very-short-patch-repair endonuclease
MAPTPDERIWARLDRGAPKPPQRALARAMRANPTEAERKLWWHLRYRMKVPRSHFRRQMQIGPYIVDFACRRLKLVVEVDGGQHAQQTAADFDRTQVLQANGYRVLRFWNNDVLANIEGVLEEIARAITATPTPDPSPRGEGKRSAVPDEANSHVSEVSR